MATPYALPPFDGMERAWSWAGQSITFPGGATTPLYFGSWPAGNNKPVIRLVEQGAPMFPARSIVSFDIEGPLTHSHKMPVEMFEANLQIKTDVITAAKRANPNAQFGMYATIPQDAIGLSQYAESKRIRDLKLADVPLTDAEKWWDGKFDEFSAFYRGWRERCADCGALAKASDFVTYVGYLEGESDNPKNDMRHDAAALRLGIQQAMKFGKPVYVYASPYRYEAQPDGSEKRFALGEKRWTACLKTIRSLGANVFIWFYTDNKPLNAYETSCMKVAGAVFR